MDRLGRLFWNSAQHRLRAGWRVTIHLLLWIFIPALLDALFGGPLSTLLARIFPLLAPIAGHATAYTLMLAGALLGTWFAAAVLDRRPFADLGFHFDRGWWLDFVFGLGLGAVLMTAIFVAELLLGWIEITGSLTVADDTPFAVAILGPLVLFIVVGITEELLARGYQIRNMAEGLTSKRIANQSAVLIAWLISSTLFGLLHVLNPNATWHSTLSLMLAGLFLGIGYLLTGELAIPIGLHITWNFFQGNIFGFPVSGNDFASATVLSIHQAGPVRWTGGAFGPEAGLIGMAAMLVGSALTVLWVRRRYGALRICAELARYRSRNG